MDAHGGNWCLLTTLEGFEEHVRDISLTSSQRRCAGGAKCMRSVRENWQG